jgi:hypothetical protein
MYPGIFEISEQLQAPFIIAIHRTNSTASGLT